jgi:hypothetical protein
MFAYDTKRKKSLNVTQWSSEPNRKHKTNDDFLDIKNCDSSGEGVENKVLQCQPAPTPRTAAVSGGSPLPSDVQKQFERRSGFSLADVQVYYNSEEPAKLGALAYTRGNVVHIGPRQEQHLPHEVGHVIQQKQVNIKPTKFIKGLPINDEPQHELNADNIHSIPTGIPSLYNLNNDVIQRITVYDAHMIAQHVFSYDMQ